MRRIGDGSMKADVEWMDLDYEVDFSTPLFDLLERSSEVLKSFHRKLNPKLPIDSDDIWVSRGRRFSDNRVRIRLPLGGGSIALTPERLSITFQSLRTSTHVARWRDGILLTEEALHEAVPDFEIQAVEVSSVLSLRLDEGSGSASDLLVQAAGTALASDLDGFGAAVCHPCVNLEIENREDDWVADFYAYRRQADDSYLRISCAVRYLEAGTIRGLDDRTSHMERLLVALLGRIGVEVSTPLSGEAENDV